MSFLSTMLVQLYLINFFVVKASLSICIATRSKMLWCSFVYLYATLNKENEPIREILVLVASSSRRSAPVLFACYKFRFSPIEDHIQTLGHDMRFPSIWYVRPAKAQTSLRIRAV